MFSRRGFHETSMNDLANEAGVTKPVVYQHFPSKGALYLELVDDVGRRLIDAIEAAAATATEPRDQVLAGLGAYFRFVSEERRAFALLFGGGAPRDDELVHAVRGAEIAVTEAIAGLLTDRLPERERTAAAIAGLAEGVARHWAASGRTATPDELAEQTAALLWGGLRQFSE